VSEAAADAVGFEPKVGSGVFYSGATTREAAKKLAESAARLAGRLGESTLTKGTRGGALLNAAEKLVPGGFPRPVWEHASKAFAQASAKIGHAIVVLAGPASPQSIWVNFERPALQAAGTTIRYFLNVVP
jgi:hypothetical protein